MGKSASIRAGRAYVELYADRSKLVRGLRLAQKHVQNFGNGIRNIGLRTAGVGAALAAPMLGAVKLFGSMGDEVAKMSKRTGVSVETLSELRFVASQTGTDFAPLEMAFRRMQRSIYDAGRGLSTAKDALEDLNLSFKDLDGLSPEEQFKLMGEAVSRVEDPTKRAAIAMSLFGRTGTNLLPMFRDGAAGIDRLQERARQLGLTMTTKDATAAEDFQDALDELWKSVRMGTFRVGAALAPALQGLGNTIADVVASLSDWIDKNRELVVVAAKVVVGIIGVGLAIAVLGMTIKALGGAFGGALKMVKLISGVFSFLLSPLGLVIAGVATLAVVLVTMTDTGARALSWLGKKFSFLAEDAKAAFGGIADALAAGDIKLAAQILWLTIKMEWQRGTNVVKKLWLDAQYYLVAAWYGLKNVWTTVCAGMRKAWAFTMRTHQTAVEKTGAGIAKIWARIQGIFDKSFDVDFALKYIEQDSRSRLAEIEQDYTKDVNRINAQTAKERADLAAESEAVLSAMAAEHLEKMAASEGELEAAKAALQEAIKAAAEQRVATEEAGDEFSPSKQLADIQAQMDAAGAGFGKAMDKVAAVGTFNAAAVRGLEGAGNDMARRTAMATEQTSRNTERLVDRLGRLQQRYT